MSKDLRELAVEAGLPTALDYHQQRYEKFASLIEAEREQSQEAQLANIANILGNLVFFMQGAAVQSKNIMLLAAAEDATKSFTALMKVRGEDFEVAQPE